MNDIFNFLTILITAVSGIGGAFIGAYFTRKSQLDLLIREENKEKRQVQKEALEIYNRVLKVDGESIVTIPVGGPIVEFDLKIYQDEIRPILFEKYHLIHDDVAKIVSEIDAIVQQCNFNEEITKEDHDDLCHKYYSLIDNIKKHIYDFRKKNN